MANAAARLPFNMFSPCEASFCLQKFVSYFPLEKSVKYDILKYIIIHMIDHIIIDSSFLLFFGLLP